MRIASDVRRSSVAGGVALAVLLAVVPMSPSAVADDEVESFIGTIPDGEWLGEMGAAGRYEGTFDEAQATVFLRIDGSFLFDVVGGSASGDWSWGGFMLINVTHPQANSVLVANTQAAGPVGGGGQSLQLSGQSTTTGRVTSSAGATEFGPNVEVLDPLNVQINWATCNTIVGDWITPLTNAMDTQGLTGSVDGTFVANYWGDEVDTDLAIRIDELYDEAEELFEEMFVDVEEGDTDFDAIAELVDRAVALELEARRQEVCVLADSGEYAYGPMAVVIAVYIQNTLLLQEVDADTLWAMVDILLWANAIGSGADPNLSDRIMPLVEDQAQRLFEEYLVEEGINGDGEPCTAAAPCLADDFDARSVLIVGERLGLQFDLAGTDMQASDVPQQSAEGDQ